MSLEVVEKAIYVEYIVPFQVINQIYHWFLYFMEFFVFITNFLKKILAYSTDEYWHLSKLCMKSQYQVNRECSLWLLHIIKSMWLILLGKFSKQFAKKD